MQNKAVNGRWWLIVIDLATYAYQSETEWRNYFRGTSAHNTSRLDGKDQSTIGGPLVWTRHTGARSECCQTFPNGLQVAEGSHQDYRNLGVLHRRSVTCAASSDVIEIQDALQGSSGHLCACCIFLLLQTWMSCCQTTACPATVSVNHARRILRFELDSNGSWRVTSGLTHPPLGWCSPCAGTQTTGPSAGRGSTTNSAVIHGHEDFTQMIAKGARTQSQYRRRVVHRTGSSLLFRMPCTRAT